VSKVDGREDGKLIVVSNAEPYKHIYGKGGQVLCQEVGGGLTTAMNPQMRKTGGTWIAYGRGEADFEVADSGGEIKVPANPDDQAEKKYTLKRIDFKTSVYDNFYRGYSNKVLWPIFHSFPTRADLHHEMDYWKQGYLPANEKYARAVIAAYEPGDMVWIHDYHLALVPQMVREEIRDAKIGVFWHIPWPPWENFPKIPHSKELLEGLMSADLLGFHIDDYVENFFKSVEKLGGDARTDKKICCIDNSFIKVNHYPLGVDFGFFDETEARDEKRFREEYGAGNIILGVDRQDYSKCIPERIRGFEEFIKKNPSYKEDVTLIQRTPESRTEIEEYQIERDDINKDVSAFNGRHGNHSWVPIKLLWRGVPQNELISEYRMADVALITPGIDGMNLVSKEFIAANREPKVLILSQFAGSSKQLDGALLVNPYDRKEVAARIKQALEMDDGEKKDRWRELRRTIKKEDLPSWADSFLTDLGGGRQQALSSTLDVGEEQVPNAHPIRSAGCSGAV
jgi:trehalose 6-phosphate synthase